MCTCNRELHAKRRAAFVEAMTARGDDAVAVFPSAPVYPRNNDVDHDFRQDSDLFYLTGFSEPQSVLVITGKDKTARLAEVLRERSSGTPTYPMSRVRPEGVEFLVDEAAAAP